MKFVDVFQFFNYLSEEMSRCNCFSTGRQGKLGMSSGVRRETMVNRSISLLRRVGILVIVCILLAEGLLVEAKGRGGGSSRGGYRGYRGGGSYGSYSGGGGGGGDLSVTTILLIVFGIIAFIFICACLMSMCDDDDDPPPNRNRGIHNFNSRNYKSPIS